ncbi:carboxymuconolactone decarboxylase family protein [Lactococcus nasutitermitis]|uniref:Carboxymuconolactone decarboxylase family protein n=1 Tax=Lactococcus nasutitermitis TaxID=1652957 RepID=A0ABV9JD15_9LACT|nr:carboxymuconolactone decarboxylase family protein [Lactococcus nasutitermitis]
MNNYEKGLKVREEVIGKSASQAVSESLRDIAPDIDNYTLLTFAEFSERTVLDMKLRELITLTSLLTQGDTAGQLRVHLQGALNVGWSKAEIIESFIQCLPYVGFPRVLNAVSVAKEVFEKQTD